jgi:hypothetical protein
VAAAMSLSALCSEFFKPKWSGDNDSYPAFRQFGSRRSCWVLKRGEMTTTLPYIADHRIKEHPWGLICYQCNDAIIAAIPLHHILDLVLLLQTCSPHARMVTRHKFTEWVRGKQGVNEIFLLIW